MIDFDRVQLRSSLDRFATRSWVPLWLGRAFIWLACQRYGHVIWHPASGQSCCMYCGSQAAA
jgi:hypothetical protein